ncbi:MAG: hypothetical protein AAGI37_21240 [Planctomycetota bacterium]
MSSSSPIGRARTSIARPGKTAGRDAPEVQPRPGGRRTTIATLPQRSTDA